MLEPEVEACAVVVSGNGLHALADAHHNHEYNHRHSVDHSVGTHGKVSAVCEQLVVQQCHYSTRGHVHREGAHTDGKDVLYNVHLRLPAVPLEVNERLGTHKVHNSQHRGEGHGDSRSPCTAADAPAQPHNKQGVKGNVKQSTTHLYPH